VSTLLRIVTIGALLGRPTGSSLGLLAVKHGPEHFEPLGRAIDECT